MMSTPSNHRILTAKRKYSAVEMDVDDNNQGAQQVQQPAGLNVQAGPFGGTSGVQQGVFCSTLTAPTPAPTAANSFPLPPPIPAQIRPPIVPSRPTSPMYSAIPVTAGGAFLSQSEGAMYSPPKKYHASQFSLQSSNKPGQYISVPDAQGIHRNVPVDQSQMQDVIGILNRCQSQPTQMPHASFGSLPSCTSTQSILSSQSSQASTGNISAISLDLPTFLMQQLQSPHSREELVRCRQLLDATLGQMAGEVSQENTSDGANVDFNNTFILSNSQELPQKSVVHSCERTDDCETSSAKEICKDAIKKPKSGAIIRILRKLIQSKL